MLATSPPALTDNCIRGAIVADLSAILQDESVQARFWSKVDVRGPDECWEWKPPKDNKGYGRLKAHATWFLATHISLGLSGRCRPPGLIALHSCDNPPCVNPQHLRWGTHKDNSNDAVLRGRMHDWRGRRSGSANPKAKITEIQVAIIRSATITNKSEMARRLGVKRYAILDIIHGRTWKS